MQLSHLIVIIAVLAAALCGCHSSASSGVGSESLHVALSVQPRTVRDLEEAVELTVTLTNRSPDTVWLPAQEILLNRNLLVAAARDPASARRELDHVLRTGFRTATPFQLGSDASIEGRLLRAGESVTVRISGLPLVALAVDSARARKVGEWFVLAAVHVEYANESGADSTIRTLRTEPISITVTGHENGALGHKTGQP